MEATYRYRIMSAEALSRIPTEGVSEPRMNLAGTEGIIERKSGYPLNERWMTHEEAINITTGIEWVLPDETL
jgi:hypothetical protein